MLVKVVEGKYQAFAMNKLNNFILLDRLLMRINYSWPIIWISLTEEARLILFWKHCFVLFKPSQSNRPHRKLTIRFSGEKNYPRGRPFLRPRAEAASPYSTRSRGLPVGIRGALNLWTFCVVCHWLHITITMSNFSDIPEYRGKGRGATRASTTGSATRRITSWWACYNEPRESSHLRVPHSIRRRGWDLQAGEWE